MWLKKPPLRTHSQSIPTIAWEKEHLWCGYAPALRWSVRPCRKAAWVLSWEARRDRAELRQERQTLIEENHRLSDEILTLKEEIIELRSQLAAALQEINKFTAVLDREASSVS